MEILTHRRKFPAARFLSVFLCVLLLFSLITSHFGMTKASATPLLYINDSVFPYWQETPPQTVDGIVYIPITMFIELENVYYFSNPKNGSFYLQNEITEEYLSFSLKTNDAYNGKSMLKINIQVFGNTMYLPAIETANNLGLYLEMNPDNSIVRLSDASAKLSFGQLTAMYTPQQTPPVVEKPPETTPVTPPNDSTQPPSVNDDHPITKPPEQTPQVVEKILPCDIYLCYANPNTDELASLLVALENENLGATFFFSHEYITENPESVMLINVKGYPTALRLDDKYTDFESYYAALTEANNALFRVTKQKTRLVATETMKNELKEAGYIPHSFDIIPQKAYSSKALAKNVISKFNSYPRARVLMGTDITAVSALYEIGSHIEEHDVLHSYSIDETV